MTAGQLIETLQKYPPESIIEVHGEVIVIVEKDDNYGYVNTVIDPYREKKK